MRRRTKHLRAGTTCSPGSTEPRARLVVVPLRRLRRALSTGSRLPTNSHVPCASGSATASKFGNNFASEGAGIPAPFFLFEADVICWMEAGNCSPKHRVVAGGGHKEKHGEGEPGVGSRGQEGQA